MYPCPKCREAAILYNKLKKLVFTRGDQKVLGVFESAVTQHWTAMQSATWCVWLLINRTTFLGA